MILKQKEISELQNRIGMEASCIIGGLPTAEEVKRLINWISETHKIPIEEVRGFVKDKFLFPLKDIISVISS